uniref:Neurotransmitter-gated ion-channel ligand-binding domain-containing protein n=1 Tax=Anopheles culicifacies TaxID=139723 RepID=A0A182LY34_9DIPT
MRSSSRLKGPERSPFREKLLLRGMDGTVRRAGHDDNLDRWFCLRTLMDGRPCLWVRLLTHLAKRMDLVLLVLVVIAAQRKVRLELLKIAGDLTVWTWGRMLCTLAPASGACKTVPFDQCKSLVRIRQESARRNPTDMATRVAVVIGLVLASLRPMAVDGKTYRNYSDIGELSKNHASLSLSDILPTHQKTYDKNRAPKLLGQPTVVYFHVTVLSIDSINEESMTYVADIFLAQSWRDPRLRLPENMSEEYRILDVDWLHSIWRPDCFFKNAKKVTFHEMSIPNHYLWLYHDKTLLYMSKLTLVLSCAMKFESYPHDTQICSMMIESCKYGNGLRG